MNWPENYFLYFVQTTTETPNRWQTKIVLRTSLFWPNPLSPHPPTSCHFFVIIWTNPPSLSEKNVLFEWPLDRFIKDQKGGSELGKSIDWSLIRSIRLNSWDHNAENLFNRWDYKGFFLQGGPQKCPYFSLAITFTKIRKRSRFFLHRYWKFIEFFWWKPL